MDVYEWVAKDDKSFSKVIDKELQVEMEHLSEIASPKFDEK
jgi:hypothetical protein